MTPNPEHTPNRGLSGGLPHPWADLSTGRRRGTQASPVQHLAITVRLQAHPPLPGWVALTCCNQAVPVVQPDTAPGSTHYGHFEIRWHGRACRLPVAGVRW